MLLSCSARCVRSVATSRPSPVRSSGAIQRLPSPSPRGPVPACACGVSSSPLAVRPVRQGRQQVVRETADAVSSSSSKIRPRAPRWGFAPGQFFTLHLSIDGESRSSAPTRRRAAPSMTVARDRAGHGQARRGRPRLVLRGRPRPRGRRRRRSRSLGLVHPATFGVAAPARARRRRAAASPRFCRSRAPSSPSEPATRLALVYGNRAPADVIFRDALEALVAANPGAFVVRHVLGAAARRLDRRHGPARRRRASRASSTPSASPTTPADRVLPVRPRPHDGGRP